MACMVPVTMPKDHYMNWKLYAGKNALNSQIFKIFLETDAYLSFYLLFAIHSTAWTVDLNPFSNLIYSACVRARALKFASYKNLNNYLSYESNFSKI